MDREKWEKEIWEKIEEYLTTKDSVDAENRLAGISMAIFNPTWRVGNIADKPEVIALEATLRSLREQCQTMTPEKIKGFVVEHMKGSELADLLTEVGDQIDVTEQRMKRGGQVETNRRPELLPFGRKVEEENGKEEPASKDRGEIFPAGAHRGDGRAWD